MNIPDEAVQRAAAAICAAAGGNVSPEHWRSEASAALETAAPFIVAEQFEAMAEHLQQYEALDKETVLWALHTRAAELRQETQQ